MPGVLPVATSLRDRDARRLVVAAADAPEAALIDGIEVLGFPTLAALMETASGAAPLPPPPPRRRPRPRRRAPRQPGPCRLQRRARPGARQARPRGRRPPADTTCSCRGRRARARPCSPAPCPASCPPSPATKPSASPPSTAWAACCPRASASSASAPFRSPHHTISNAGLVGGGRKPRPGEISLAHHGVLFLDELPEFNVGALESLRQPLEDRVVTIARVHGAVTYPANFMLVAAMNPCPCGNYGDPVAACTCPESAVLRYQRRISGPLLDRIDSLRRSPPRRLRQARRPHRPRAIERRPRPHRARPGPQIARDDGQARPPHAPAPTNAALSPRQVRERCQEQLSAEAGALIKMAMAQLHLSARAFNRGLKVARTVADLAAPTPLRPPTSPKRSSTGVAGLGGESGRPCTCTDCKYDLQSVTRCDRDAIEVAPSPTSPPPHPIEAAPPSPKPSSAEAIQYRRRGSGR